MHFTIHLKSKLVVTLVFDYMQQYMILEYMRVSIFSIRIIN